MANQNVLRTLVNMDDQKAYNILAKATGLYLEKLAEIAEDIYDSCIEDYYAQYTPMKYDRHGDITGFNLYSANNIVFDEMSYNVDIDFDPNKLLGYYDGKKNREKRDKVLNSVMAGLRGAKSKKSPPGWPQKWNTSYPNQYSQYNFWKSKGATMDKIFEDFMSNVINETQDLLHNCIRELL